MDSKNFGICDGPIKISEKHYPGRRHWRLVRGQGKVRVGYIGLGVFCYVWIGIIWGILWYLILQRIEGGAFKTQISVLAIILGVSAISILYFFNIKSRKKGDWLVYDADTNIIKLPRISVEFSKDDLYLIQVIVGDPEFNEYLWAEVNLVLNEKSGFTRYPLIQAGSENLIRPLVSELSREFSVGVRKVKNSFNRKCKIENT